MRGAYILLCLLIIIPFASSLDEGMCADVFVTDISPSSVNPGEDFTVGIGIENCGEIIPQNITFQITRVSPDISIQEPLMENIGQLGYANSKRFLTYHMTASKNIKPGTYYLETKLSYGKDNFFIDKTANFNITISGKNAELAIASVKTNPILPIKGDTVELTFRIENSGQGTAKNVRVYTNHSFQGIKQSFIGSLEANEDGPAVFTFITDKSGEFDFPVAISYNDEFGEKEIKTNVNLIVLEKNSEMGKTIFAIVILATISGLVFYIIKIKKSKDKIIHQLLKGNPSEKSRK